MGEQKMVAYYKGRPVTELSRDELIEALKEAWHIIDDIYVRHDHDLNEQGDYTTNRSDLW